MKKVEVRGSALFGIKWTLNPKRAPVLNPKNTSPIAPLPKHEIQAPGPSRFGAQSRAHTLHLGSLHDQIALDQLLRQVAHRACGNLSASIQDDKVLGDFPSELELLFDE